jgi:hypothetical protein
MGLWLLRSYKEGSPHWEGRNRSRWIYFKNAFPRNLRHYSTAILGLGLKLDPQCQPDVPFYEMVMLLVEWAALLAFGIALNRAGQPELLLGLLFFWVSPLWLYTLEPFLYPDMVFEWRAYLAVLGLGMMVSALPSYIGWSLVLIWAVQSWLRSFAFRSKEAYASQALKENPLAQRQQNNLNLFIDFGAAKKIGALLAEGKPIPPELLEMTDPVRRSKIV